MTGCILHLEDEHPPEPGWLCCQRGRDRMLYALRDLPGLVAELYGLGSVERDTRPGTRAVRDGARVVRVPAAADPVANAWPAGPAKGGWRESRISGTRPERVPVSLGHTDLTARARYGSLAVAATSPWPDDQVGDLAVATELEFWARDWADQRGERSPVPTVDRLSVWLVDRLDWACGNHAALDEFAGKLHDLRTALTHATGGFDPLPARVDRPCPACGWWTLSHRPGENLIDCGRCDRSLTEAEYRDHLEDVIKTNWNRFDYNDKPNTAPKHDNPVLIREDFYTDGVTLGFFDGYTFRMWAGSDDCSVSYWAEIHYPADPGPAKDDTA